jgi:hypothetical protein
MTLRIQSFSLFLSVIVVQSALAEPSASDALVGEWKSVPIENKGSSTKQRDFETTFSVKKNHQFVMSRKVTKSNTTVIYSGIITEIKGKMIAEVILGPVVCGSSAPNRDWSVSIENDKLTVYYSERNSESFVRFTKQETTPSEQAVGGNRR